MKSLTRMLSFVLLALAVSLSACRKDKDEELDTETQSSSDNFLAENQVNDVFKEVDAAAGTSQLGKTGPVIIIDSASSPKKMTIDYGNSTLCADGKIRSGQLIVTWTGRYRESGTVITIVPDSFYQGGNHIEGAKTIKNEGRNSGGNLYYTITADVTITRVDGRTITWKANRQREWVSGESTPAWNDDVYLLTGSASGLNGNGLTYASTITTAVRVDLSCQYRITAGVIELTPQGKRTREVNYGNGDCDNAFTVKIGNRTFNVN